MRRRENNGLLICGAVRGKRYLKSNIREEED
jgi:hypothetical protein